MTEDYDPTLYETAEDAAEVRDALIENAQMEEEIFGTINVTDYADNLEVREIGFDTWVLYDRKHNVYYEVYVCRDCGAPDCTWGEWIPMIDPADATHFQHLVDSDTSDPDTDWADAGAWLSAEDSRKTMIGALPNRTRHRPFQKQQERSSWVSADFSKKGDQNYDTIPRSDTVLREDILILPYNTILNVVDMDNPANEDYEPPVNYDSIQDAADAAYEHAKECAKWAIPGMESHEEALIDAKDAAISALNVNEEALKNKEGLSDEERNLVIQENSDKIEVVKELEPQNDEYESFALVQEAMELVRQGWQALMEKDRAKALELVRLAAEKVIEAQKAAKDPDQNAFTRMAADHVAELVKAIIRANLTEPEPEPDPAMPPPDPSDPDQPPPPPTTPDLEDLLERLTEGSETEQLVSKAKDIFDNGWIPIIDEAETKDESDPNEKIAKESLMKGAQALTDEIVDLVLEARDKANMRDTNDREALRLGKDIAEQALTGTKQYNPNYAEQMEKILYLLELREDEKEWALWSEQEQEFYRTGSNKLTKPLIFPTEQEGKDFLDANEHLTDTGDWVVIEWKGDGYEEFKQEELPEEEWPDFKKAWDEAMTPDMPDPEVPDIPDDTEVPIPKKTPIDLCEEIEEKRKQQQEQQPDSTPPSSGGEPSDGPSGECKDCADKAEEARDQAEQAGTTRTELEPLVEEAIKQAEEAMDTGNVTDPADRKDMERAIDAAAEANANLGNYPTLQEENAQRIDELRERFEEMDPDNSAAAGTAQGEFSRGEISEPWADMDNTEKIERMKEECEAMAESGGDAAAMDAVREANMAAEMADPNNAKQMEDAQAALDAAMEAVLTSDLHELMDSVSDIQDLLDEKKKMAQEVPIPTQSAIDEIERKLDTAMIDAETSEDIDTIMDAVDRLQETAEANGLDFTKEDFLQNEPSMGEYGTNADLAEEARKQTDKETCEDYARQAQDAADQGKLAVDRGDIDKAQDFLEAAQNLQEECVKYGDKTDSTDLAHMENAHNAVGELMDKIENEGPLTPDQDARFNALEDRRDEFDDKFMMEHLDDEKDSIFSDAKEAAYDAHGQMDDMLPMGDEILTQEKADTLNEKLKEAAEKARTWDDVEKVVETNEKLSTAMQERGLDWEDITVDTERGFAPISEDFFDEDYAKDAAEEADARVNDARDLFESNNPDDNDSLDLAKYACEKAKEALQYTESEETALEANRAVEKATQLMNEIADKNDIDTLGQTMEDAAEGRVLTDEEQAWVDAREAANDYDDAAGEWTEDEGKTLQSDSKDICDDAMSDYETADSYVPPLTEEELQRQQQMKEETMEMAEMMKEAFEQSELDDEEELDALDSAVDAVMDSVDDLLTLTPDDEEREEIQELQSELEKMKEAIAKARYIVLGEAEKAALAAKVAEIERRAKDIAEKQVKFVNLKTGEIILANPSTLTDRSYRRVRTYDTGSLDAHSNSIMIDVTLDGVAEWVSKCCSMTVTPTGAPPTKLVIDTNDVNVSHWEDSLSKLRFFRVERLPDNSLQVTYP